MNHSEIFEGIKELLVIMIGIGVMLFKKSPYGLEIHDEIFTDGMM